MCTQISFKREEPDSQRPRVASKSEIERLWSLCQERKKSIYWKMATLGSRDEVMLALYYGCGLRRSEAVALNRDDLTGDKLRVKTSKNNKPRLVPMSSRVIEAISDWQSNYRSCFVRIDRPTNALLLSERGRRITGQSLMLRLKALCKEAEIQPLTLHGLRHSVATHLLAAGMPLTSVSRFLGHSTLDSTQIYTRHSLDLSGLRQQQPYK